MEGSEEAIVFTKGEVPNLSPWWPRGAFEADGTEVVQKFIMLALAFQEEAKKKG